jgi:hypothetical protein
MLEARRFIQPGPGSDAPTAPAQHQCRVSESLLAYAVVLQSGARFDLLGPLSVPAAVPYLLRACPLLTRCRRAWYMT